MSDLSTYEDGQLRVLGRRIATIVEDLQRERRSRNRQKRLLALHGVQNGELACDAIEEVLRLRAVVREVEGW